MSNGSNPVSVSSLTVYGGELIAAGYFNTAGGVPPATTSPAGTAPLGNRWTAG